MKKRYILWSMFFIISSVFMFSFLFSGCSKPKVIFENEYIKIYENKKDLKSWNPDWQEGEYWTVYYCDYYVPYNPKRNPYYQISPNSKYLFAGKDVIKEGKTNLIHVNNIDIEVLFETYYSSEIITYRISYVEQFYNIHSYSIIDNGEPRRIMVGSKYPGSENFDLPIELPMFPLNLEKEEDIKEFTTTHERKIYTPELREELDILKKKRKILSKSYSDAEWENIQSRYPEFKEVENTTKSRIEKKQDFIEKLIEISAKAETIEINSKIYQIVKKIEFKNIRKEISILNFSEEQIIKIFTKDGDSYKVQEIKLKDYVNKYIDDMYKIDKFSANDTFFTVKVINEDVENSKKDLNLYQIWSTKYNWPLLSFRVSSNRPYHISFLFIKNK